MVIVGIDPGAKGAIAVIDYELDLSFIHDMPLKDSEIDTSAVVKVLSALNAPLVIIEEQQSFPKQGVASTFTTGKRFGWLLGIIEALELKLIRIRPNIWKKEYSIGRDKEASCLMASELYPDHEYYGPRGGKMDGRAEAILMAEYGRRHFL